MITRLLSVAQRMSFERNVKINKIKEETFFQQHTLGKKLVKRAYKHHKQSKSAATQSTHAHPAPPYPLCGRNK